MSSNVLLSGSLAMSNTNTPTRAGQKVASESEIASIETPVIGMIIYIEDTDKFVYVKSLKSEKIGNDIEIKNALIDEYKPLVSKTNEEINLNWNEVL